MAATQGYISGQEIPLDDLPSWKRELILRKRANARIHGAMGLPVPTPMAGRGRGSLSGPTSSTSSPVSGPQEASCSLSGAGPPLPRANTTTAVSTRAVGVRGAVCSEDARKDQKYAVTSDPSITTVNTTMHHKGLHDEGPRVTSPAYSSVSDSCNTTEDEDLRYGPGIVSKLKNRYMSLAMRESRSRPSLRRFSSLEDLLDSEPRGPIAAKPHAAPDSGRAHRREVMRRARSVDSLSSRLADDSRRVRTPAMAKSKSASSQLQSSLNPLGKEDVIIIETSRSPVTRESQAVNGAAPRSMEPSRSRQRQLSSSSIGEEEDLPAPDTVRHVKKIFESSGSRPPRGTAARIAAHKAAQSSKSNGVAPASKPALKAKPAVVPPRKVTPPSGPAHAVTIEEAKVSLKKVTQVVRPTPRSTLSVRATALNGEGSAGGVSGQEAAAKERVRLGLTPVTASVTAPVVNGDPAPRQARGESCSAGKVEEGVRRISSAAVSNIRSESHSQEFNFTDRSVSSPSVPKAASPAPSPLPASPIASHRVPSHPPVSSKVERVDESDRVHLENLKNVEKSRSPPVDVRTSPVFPKVVSPSQPSLNAVKQGKVEPGVPDSRGQGKVSPKQGFTRKVEPKSEVRSVGETEPAKLSPPPTEELVRGLVGRGGLVEAFNKTPAGGSPAVLTPTKPSPKRDRWHQQENTSLVFNFTSSKKETPDYIENDGVDLSRRRPEGKLDSGYVIMPGWDGRLDSSTDGDDLDDGLDYLDCRPGVTPAPSGIVFEGEAVIINGRSNLQRQPRSRKLKITFDDALTSTYEYPSENYLLEEAGLLPAEATEGSSASQGRGRSGTPRPMVSGTCSVTIQVGEGNRTSSASHHKSSDEPFSVPTLSLLSSTYQQDHKALPLSSWEDKNAALVRTSRNTVKSHSDSFGKVGSVKLGKKAKKCSPSPSVDSGEIDSNKQNRNELTATPAPLLPKPFTPHSTPSQTTSTPPPKLYAPHPKTEPNSTTTHSTPPYKPIATLTAPTHKPETPQTKPGLNSIDNSSPPKPGVPSSTPPRPAPPNLTPKSKPDVPHTISSKTHSSPSTPPPKPGSPHSTPPPRPAPPHSTPPSMPGSLHSIQLSRPAPSHSTPSPTPSFPHSTPPARPAPPHSSPSSSKTDIPHLTPQLKSEVSHSLSPVKPNAPHSTSQSEGNTSPSTSQPKANLSHSIPPSKSDTSHSAPQPKPKNRRSKRRGNKDVPDSEPMLLNLDAQHLVPTPAPRNVPLTPTPKPRTRVPNIETNNAKAVKQSGTPQSYEAENYHPTSIPDVISMTQKTFSQNSESVAWLATPLARSRLVVPLSWEFPGQLLLYRLHLLLLLLR